MRSIFLLFALLFAFCAEPLFGQTNVSPEQVVDTGGKGVQAGKDYYIRPVPSSTICQGMRPCIGPGFALIPKSANKTCPLSVAVVGGSQGQPVTFTPYNSTKGVIRVSTDLNIKTDVKTNCTESTVWKLDNFDASTGQYFVTTGGVLGNPGKDTLSNWFKIEKYEGDYRLEFCPTVCNTCKPLCKNVGVFVDSDGNQRAALVDDPYKVQFQLASS